MTIIIIIIIIIITLKIKKGLAKLPTVERVLKSVVSKYKNISLSNSHFNPYASNPPKALYDKLNKVMQTAATYNYKERWEEIEDDITKKVREQLVKIREKLRITESREIETRIRICESILTSLPEHMQTILREEIVQCRGDIKYEAEHASKEVEQVMQKKNIQDINELLARCTINQEKAIRAGVDDMAREVIARMDKQWSEGDTKGALLSMSELYRFKATFKKKIPELGRYIENARNSLSLSFDKSQRSIVNYFDSLDQGI
ncbi:hypothetical protein RFI_14076, partial [Reticulomyxa filosa]